MVTNHIIEKVSVDVQELLQSLVEIKSIAYANEESRSPRSVLRLHNLTWFHAFLCWCIVGFHTKRMTSHKFYGAYFHKISAHAAIQNRLISGKSCHAAEQERVFNAITNITRDIHPRNLDILLEICFYSYKSKWIWEYTIQIIAPQSSKLIFQSWLILFLP